MAINQRVKKWLMVAMAWLPLGALCSAQQYFEGEGTAYALGRTDAGNCNMMHANSDATINYAAINNVQWDTLRNCGRCAEVSCADARCADKTTTKIVQILDRCPECGFGDLDLSPSVFTTITGTGPDRYKIRWRFVDCPTMQGPVKYCLKGGSNPFWTAVQPTNVVSGVTSLTINGRATTSLGTAYYYLLDGQSSSQTDLSAVQITLTSVNGEVIQDTVSLSAGECTDGSSQFKRGLIVSPVVAPAPTEAPGLLQQTPQPSSPSSTPPPADEDSMSSTDPSTDEPRSTSSQDDVLTPTTPSPPQMEEGVLTEETPTSTTPAVTASEPDDDMRETVTKAEAISAGTSPTVIALSICGAAAVVALVVVAWIARNKKIEEKRHDAEADLAIMRQAAFVTIITPTGQRISSLRMPSECDL